MGDGVKSLALEFPWPRDNPGLRFDPQGWFGWCHRLMLRKALPEKADVVLELGSWLGRSTRFFLNRYRKSTVIAVDHWGHSDLIAKDDPSSEEKMSNLFDRFASNCWSFRKRLIPVRATTVAGMQLVSQHSICPQVVYIDANHTYEDMMQDVSMAFSLFPGARLCGDDYGGKWVGVKKALDQFCEGNGCRLFAVQHAWAMYRGGENLPEVSTKELARAMRQAGIEPPKNEEQGET